MPSSTSLKATKESIHFVEADVHYADICTALDAQAFDSNNYPYDVMRTLLASPNTLALVAMSGDGEPVGHVLCALAREMCDLLTVCIVPSLQGQKLGRLLLDETMMRLKARGVESIFLEVRQSNMSALGLYRSVGGCIVGERKDYYKNADSTTEHASVIEISL